MKYEKIENKYIKKGRKWILDFTTAKKINEDDIKKIENAFKNVPVSYKKRKEEYISISKNYDNGIKYTIDNGQVKREIIILLIKKED